MEKTKELIKSIRKDPHTKKELLSFLLEFLDLRANQFHPLVFINGKPEFGKNVYIGLFSEINAKGSKVAIGDNCDIASFVSINVSDSHKRCIGLSSQIDKGPIILENDVFVGSHSFVGSNTTIGHHSVIGAGTVLINAGKIPPYSLVVGNPAKIKKGYFLKNIK